MRGKDSLIEFLVREIEPRGALEIYKFAIVRFDPSLPSQIRKGSERGSRNERRLPTPGPSGAARTTNIFYPSVFCLIKSENTSTTRGSK